ncbi:MAG: TIGR01777 family protein [Melioribacter sp.]|nr:TIGR01777 family protein [Melioribacter sp.]
MKKVIITGATGFIGKRITEELITRGDEVTIFTRSVENAKQKIPNAYDYVEWNPELNDWSHKLEDKDAVVHLAGENVMAKRWNLKHKKNILSSRVEGTRSLVNAIGRLKNKPEVFITASAVGYYGNSEKPVNENSEPGEDFLAEVVNAWEKEAGNVESYGVRRVSIRTGIVLDANEGALVPMINQFKFFVGGPIGKGKQWFPWVHIDDVVGIFLFALNNQNVRGALNASSPNPLRMKEFCKTLGNIMHRPSLFKVPAFTIKILFGEAADVLLNGAQVIPDRTIKAGYKFKFESAEESLRNLLHK